MTVFEKRVLRKTFGPRREEVTGDWRRLYKEEFHDLCSSFYGATTPSGPGPPHCRGFTITFSYTHHLR
jgi:regulator of replication initiation timing